MSSVSASVPSHARRRHPLSRLKKTAFSLVTVLLVWGVIETLSLFGLWGSEYDFHWENLTERQQHIARGAATKDESQETIHPFHGWAFNPQVSSGVDFAGRCIPVNEFGFVDDGPAVLKRRPQHVVVGIAGGSVAWQMTVAGEAAFKSRLARELGRASDDIKVVRLAMSGFKQPQQLMALNWLMTHGAEFDIVVNLDGYNEAVGANDNRKARVNMAYPTAWHARTRDIVDPREYAYSLELFQLRGQRQQIAQAALTSWCRWSPTYQLIWYWREARIRERRIDLGRMIVIDPETAQTHGFASSGPAQSFADHEQADQFAVQIWSNSSQQMESLCRGAGCRYLHCLQPNQYVPDSKEFTAEERTKFLHEESEHAAIVRRVFPQFARRGTELSENGFPFRDLTMLFAGTRETVYSDGWCHFNELGSRLLGEEIAREVAVLLKAERSK